MGRLQDMEESDEINACSVVVPVEMDYGDGPGNGRVAGIFKNETHNHPTEIEPFGGAATCLGGATVIRYPVVATFIRQCVLPEQQIRLYR